jgi:DNA-binding response OmpR family regulator
MPKTARRRARLLCLSAGGMGRLHDTRLLSLLEERGVRVFTESLTAPRVTELEEADVVVLTSRDALPLETIAGFRRVGLTTGIAVLAEGRMAAIEERLLDAGADLVLALEHDARTNASKLESLARRVRGDWTRVTSGASDDLRIDVGARSVHVRSARVELGATAFRLFLYFVDQAERWVSDARIVRDVFGTYHAPGASIVRVHVSSLRKAIAPLGLQIQNRRSVGYRLVTNRNRTATNDRG